MSVEGHIQALKSKKAELEKQVHDAELNPGADDLRTLELKREKLRIKDELHKLGHA